MAAHFIVGLVEISINTFTGAIPYYIVRNSWGDDFGDKGYLYIKIGGNLCGITRFTFYYSYRNHYCSILTHSFSEITTGTVLLMSKTWQQNKIYCSCFTEVLKRYL